MRLDRIQAQCNAFGPEADAHAFAAALGLVQAPERVADRCWSVVRHMLDADAEWREATTWRTRAAELQRDVTTRAWSADLQPELQTDVVPLMLLEVLHDALREGPFWCEPGAPQRHCAVGVLQLMHSGRPLDHELRARGRFVPKQALHDQRAALEASVYDNRFCQVHAGLAVRCTQTHSSANA